MAVEFQTQPLGSVLHVGVAEASDHRPVARFETSAGVTHGHAFLMAILMYQRLRVQVQRVAFAQRR